MILLVLFNFSAPRRQTKSQCHQSPTIIFRSKEQTRLTIKYSYYVILIMQFAGFCCFFGNVLVGPQVFYEMLIYQRLFICQIISSLLNDTIHIPVDHFTMQRKHRAGII